MADFDFGAPLGPRLTDFIPTTGGILAQQNVSSFADQMSTGTGALPTVQDIIGLGEPQRSYKWLVLLPPVGSTNISLSSWYVMRISPQFVTLATTEVWQGAHSYKVASDTQVAPVTISLYMDQAQKSLQYYQGWNSAIKNPDRTYNYDATYKRDISLILFDIANMPVLQLNLVGCFPLVADIGSLAFTSSEHLVLNCVFSVDDMDFEVFQNGAAVNAPSQVFRF